MTDREYFHQLRYEADKTSNWKTKDEAEYTPSDIVYSAMENADATLQSGDIDKTQYWEFALDQIEGNLSLNLLHPKTKAWFAQRGFPSILPSLEKKAIYEDGVRVYFDRLGNRLP